MVWKRGESRESINCRERERECNSAYGQMNWQKKYELGFPTVENPTFTQSEKYGPLIEIE